MKDAINIATISNIGIVEESTTDAIKYNIYAFFKRLFDIICSLVGFLLLIPVTICVKVAYMLQGDFQKVFYYQNRIGKNGKEFKFYKFRTMIQNADEVLFKMLEEDEALREEYRINKKLKNDPRITKVGKVLRKSSLDELPQVINVFLGQMSIIGNRPYLPREKEDMGEYFDDILSTKPGLTGYWQVSGRSETTFKERLILEKYYSKHFGFKMDLKIFFRTFYVVLFRKGAEK